MAMILDGTNGAFLPTWTTGSRPASPSNGEIGYNSTTGLVDQYVGSAWTSMPATNVAATWSGQQTFVAPILGTPASGNLSNTTADGTTSVGFLSIPQNSQSTAYTTVLADAGKCIFHPASDANARTFTIAANSSVAYPIGTVLQFINMTSQVVTISITSDTLTWSSGGGTGSRTLAQYGVANCIKIATTQWLITGSNLT